MPSPWRWWRGRGCGPCAPCGTWFLTVATSQIPFSFPVLRFATRRPAGLGFSEAFILRHGVVLHDLALEDPDLDAAGAVGGERSGNAVIDVGAERVQRH